MLRSDPRALHRALARALWSIRDLVLEVVDYWAIIRL